MMRYRIEVLESRTNNASHIGLDETVDRIDANGVEWTPSDLVAAVKDRLAEDGRNPDDYDVEITEVA